MVYVNEDQLDQVHYILEQSSLGNHILFDNDTIKRIAISPSEDELDEIEKERIEAAEALLEQLILCPTLDAKRNFLENLDAGTFEDVVRVYLNVVHNTIADSHNYLH